MRHADRRRPPMVRLLSPLRDFLQTETSGAVLLAGGAMFAMAWANSPWRGSYQRFWTNPASVSLAGHVLELDVRHWINDGLMTVFFLVVGLEIKRELTSGHLASRRAAFLPLAAALGGMLTPALIYLAIAGGSAPRGWAVPMATDIALAVGVLAVVGSRVPSSLRALLLGLAIVDDIGAIIVIAVVYSTGLKAAWLLGALAAIGATVLARRAEIRQTWCFIGLGAIAWLCLYEGGVHPTLAGVVMGLLAPSVPLIRPDLVDVDELVDLSTPEAARTSTDIARNSVSVVEWLQHVLHPWTSYLIVPLFALANAGIEITSKGVRSASTSAITWGIIAGLVIGKPLGIVIATKLAVRSGLANAPGEATGRHILGIGTAAGIGFTVALFITELAFTDAQQRTDAKLAIGAASVTAAALSVVILSRRSRQSVAHVEFRSARAQDASTLADLKVASWQSAYADLIDPEVLEPFLDPITQRSTFLQLIGDPNAIVLVADDDGVVVAFGVGDARSGYIDSLHVLPSRRSLGIGRQLLAALAHVLQDRGCSELSLHVVRGNTRARRFYERLGGELTGTAPAEWAPAAVEEAHYLWRDPSVLNTE